MDPKNTLDHRLRVIRHVGVTLFIGNRMCYHQHILKPPHALKETKYLFLISSPVNTFSINF